MNKKILVSMISILLLLVLASCSILPTPTVAKTATPISNATPTTMPGMSSTQIPSASEPLAKIAELEQGVFVTDPGGKNRHVAAIGESLFLGSEITSDAKGRAKIFFSDGTTVRLAPNTKVVVSSRSKDALGQWNTKLNMSLGQIWIALQGGSMDVDTPVGVGAVRGSYLSITLVLNASGVVTGIEATCLEGSCQLKGATSNEVKNFTQGEKVTLAVTGNTTQLQLSQMTAAELNQWIQNNVEPNIVTLAIAAAAKNGDLSFKPDTNTGSTLPKAP